DAAGSSAIPCVGCRGAPAFLHRPAPSPFQAVRETSVPRPHRRRAVAVIVSLTALVGGCRRTGGAASELVQAPTIESATGESRCGVRASASKPLVVEWPAAERAALEARAASGLVAVRYAGCEMEVLTSCSAGGGYNYVGLTQKTEGVRITDADQLYAQLPVGAAKLEAKLKRAGQLNVDMVIVGRKEAGTTEIAAADLQGRCDEATHVVTGLTLGAFSFYSGASAEVGGGIEIGNAGAGGSSTAGQEIIKSDGDGAACSAASSADEAAPDGCAAIIRVEVVPIERTPGDPTVTIETSADAPTEPLDPAARKQVKRAMGVFYGGLITTVVGVPLVGVGTSMFLGNRRKLESEVGADEVADDRQSNITRARTGLGLLGAGIGIAATGIGLVVGGGLRARKVRREATARVAPVIGPGTAGIQIGGRF
ncbi:MAG: hypothetical protein AAF721_04775, partial [Myxococcota bacterium]